MRTFARIPELKAALRSEKSRGKTVGLVPTMGFLHEGHLSLVRASKAAAGVTVVSVFVNPAQFGPAEDLARYPRDLARDSGLLEAEGADILFVPSSAEMYPDGYRTYVEVEGLQDKLCGRSRPGHFRGVATVVLKLINIVEPDVAYFGRKDAQQAILLERMVKDLNLGVRIETLPIVREPDGLAMSSRNSYLGPAERKAALVLSRGLAAAAALWRSGEKDAETALAEIRRAVAAEPMARLDYVEAVDPATLDPVSELVPGTLIALAVFVGKTRLIDNVVLGRETR